MKERERKKLSLPKAKKLTKKERYEQIKLEAREKSQRSVFAADGRDLGAPDDFEGDEKTLTRKTKAKLFENLLSFSFS